MTMPELPTLFCCEHVPPDAFAAVVQKNPDSAPYVTFANLPRSGVMEISFKSVRILCRTCFMLKG